MVTTLAVLVLAAAAQGRDQTDWAAPRIALGFGVDTSLPPVGDIFRMWRAFLQDRPDSLHRGPHWSWSEQTQYRDYLLGRDYLFQGFPKQFPSVTVLTITPAVPGEESLDVIRTLVGGVYQPGDEVRLLGIFRVYAQRTADGWALSNAISRVSANWIREPIGSIAFVYPSWRRLDRGRARRSARFADSLARAFGLPSLRVLSQEPLELYPGQRPDRTAAGRPRYALRDRGDTVPARLRAWRHSRRPLAVSREGETPSDVRLGFAKALGVAPDALDAAWRRKVLSYAR